MRIIGGRPHAGHFIFIEGAGDLAHKSIADLLGFGKLIPLPPSQDVTGPLEIHFSRDEKYHDLTIATLTGFLIGSLNKLWPWKEKLGDAPLHIHSDGREDWLEGNVLPGNFEGEPQVMFVVLLAVVGFAIIFLMERFAASKPTEAEA